MKQKLTLLLLALVTAMGGWAESNYFVTAKTQVTSITSGKYYVIDGLNQVNSNTHFLYDNGTKVASANPQALPTDYTAGKFVWKIEGNAGDGYTLRNLATGNYMSLGNSDGSTISTGSTPQANVIYYDGTTEHFTICNATSNQAIDIGYNGDNPSTWEGSTTSAAGSRRLKIYEADVVEIADNACYTISFQSKATSKTWGLKAGTTRQTPVLNATGDVFVAHSYTNLAGAKRWIFVNNSNGEYLAYFGDATTTFNISHAINEWNIASLTPGAGSVNADANVSGRLCITNDKRYTNNSYLGCYNLKEETGAYDNTGGPFFDGTYTSALEFTATGDAVSSAATLAIAKFEALNEVRGYLPYAANISALFADPSVVEAAINDAADAAAAASIATTFMKSPEGKKFYAVNSTATGNYLNLGTSQMTATATKLYAEAAMEVEYAGNGKYYLKGVKSGYYAGNPTSGSANPGTVSAKGSATTFYIGNYENSVDNVVYFARTKTGAIEAIHYSASYPAAACVVAWTYNAGASQWNITAISDDDYTALLNVCDVTYNVIVAPSGTVKGSATQTEVIGSAFTTVPSGIAKEFASYTFYSDAACTEELSVVPNANATTVYALAATAGDAPFVASDNYSTATWYNLKLRDAYPSYADATPNVTLPSNPSSTENNVEWAFIGNPYDGYQIINKAAGDGKVLGAASAASDGATGANTYATFATAGTQTYERWFPKSSTHATNGFYLFDGEGYALNKRSNANLAFWTGGYDAGSTFEAFAVTDNSAELTEIATRLAAKTYGSGYGEYSLTGGYAGYESMMAISIIPAFENYSYDNLLIARALDAAKSLNIPQAGDFLRIKASATNKSAYSVSDDIYLKSNNTQSDVNNGTYKNNRVAFELGSASDNTTIFYYDAESHLTGFANGYQPMNNSNQMKIGGVGATATIVTFESMGDTENKAFRVEFNSGGRSLYTQRYSGVYFTDAANGDATDAHYRYFVEKVTSLPVTISAAGYATLYAPVALTIPSGVQAYYISSLTTTEATLTEIETTIAANTPVILKATAGTYDFVITTGGTDVSTTNKLAGQVTAFAVSADDVTNKVYYTLQQNVAGDAVGLFPKTAEGSIAGFKAYLPAANFPSAGVKGFTFIFDDDATGLEGVQDVQEVQGAIYNLAGQRLNKIQKGINIVNGKKILK